MARPDDLSQLNSADWQQLLEVLDRLEAGLAKPESVDLTTLLPPVGSPQRLVYLYEMVKTELEIRYRQKRGQPLEHYLQRYPELGSQATLSPALIYEEFLARQRHGDRPQLVGYQERFPQQFDDLLRLLDKEGAANLRESHAPKAPAKKAALQDGKQSAQPAAPEVQGDYLLQVGGGYRLRQKLGSGAFGDVYRAVSSTGSLVAVKWMARTLDNEACRLEKESLETIRLLQHPHLLRTRESHIVDGRLVLIMDLAESSLSDRLRQCRAEDLPGIPVDELLRYFQQAAEALDYLHQHKVTHRDIKPENLLLKDGQVLVADFGLAREQDSSTIMTSQVCGTPVYMPPEIWDNRVSYNSDQYSLAVTYVELRLGRPLYRPGSVYELRQYHLRGVPDLSPLEGAEKDALLRALARDRHQRYPSCQHFVQALTQSLQHSSEPLFPSPHVRRAFLVTGLLVLALVLYWLWLR